MRTTDEETWPDIEGGTLSMSEGEEEVGDESG